MSTEIYQHANYYHKTHLAWLRHCAKIVEPCGKEIGEVIAYLTKNYDIELMTPEQLNKHASHFAEHINIERSSDASVGIINKMDLSESDMTFTVASMTTAQFGNQPYERVSKDMLLMQGCKIPMTDKNIKRIAEMAVFSNTSHMKLYEHFTHDHCGNVFWDYNLQYFFTKGYGQFEIMDDLRFYHGVTEYDIENLTHRFSRFAQLFPRGDYSMSFQQFMNDMDMCQRYGFYNNQRLFTEMLDSINVTYEFLGESSADTFKQKWYESFVPPTLHEYAEKHYYFNNNGCAGYLWHVFSYGDLACLEHNQAISTFDSKQKDECIIFFSNYDYAFKVMDAGNLNAKMLENYRDIHVVDTDFTWTYIHPHDAMCGPYFYEQAR